MIAGSSIPVNALFTIIASSPVSSAFSPAAVSSVLDSAAAAVVSAAALVSEEEAPQPDKETVAIRAAIDTAKTFFINKYLLYSFHPPHGIFMMPLLYLVFLHDGIIVFPTFLSIVH